MNQKDEWDRTVSMARLIEESGLVRAATKADTEFSIWPMVFAVLLTTAAFASKMLLPDLVARMGVEWFPLAAGGVAALIVIGYYGIRWAIALPAQTNLPGLVMSWEADMPLLAVIKAAYDNNLDDVPLGAKQVALKLKDGHTLNRKEALVYVKAVRLAAKRVRTRETERRFAIEVGEVKLLPPPAAPGNEAESFAE